MQAFGIASFVISILAIFIPIFGIFLSGLSGFLAWLSAGRGTTLGAAATIINVLNLFFLSPAYMLAVGLEHSQRSIEETRLFTVWLIILFIQIATVVVFIINLLISKVDISFSKPLRPKTNTRNNHAPCLNPMKSEKTEFPTIDVIDISPNVNASKVTKVLIHKVHGGRKKDSKFWNDEIDISKNNIIENKNHLVRRHGGSNNYSKYRIPWVYSITVSSVLLVGLLSFRPEILNFIHPKDSLNDIRPQHSSTPKKEIKTLLAQPKTIKTTPNKKHYKKTRKKSSVYLVKLQNGSEIRASKVKTKGKYVKITYKDGIEATVPKSSVLGIEIL